MSDWGKSKAHRFQRIWLIIGFRGKHVKSPQGILYEAHHRLRHQRTCSHRESLCHSHMGAHADHSEPPPPPHGLGGDNKRYPALDYIFQVKQAHAAHTEAVRVGSKSATTRGPSFYNIPSVQNVSRLHKGTRTHAPSCSLTGLHPHTTRSERLTGTHPALHLH